MRGIFFIIVLFLPYSLWANLLFENLQLELKVKENAPAYPFEFHYKNMSDKTVEIIDVKTTCGCTAIVEKGKTVKPFSEGVIKGSFSPNGLIGTDEKNLYVLTNDLAQSEIKLTLKIQILPIMTLSKKMLVWRLGDKSTKNVKISILDDSFNFESISCESENFDIKIVYITAKEINLFVAPKSTEIKERNHAVILFKSDKEERAYNVFFLII